MYGLYRGLVLAIFSLELWISGASPDAHTYIQNLDSFHLKKCFENYTRDIRFSKVTGKKLTATSNVILLSTERIINSEDCPVECVKHPDCAACTSTTNTPNGFICSLYEVETPGLLPTTDTALSTTYLTEWNGCEENDCSATYSTGCVDGVNTVTCACKAGFGTFDKNCHIPDPYMEFDFSTNLFWNYGGAIKSTPEQPWGKYGYFAEANNRITIQDSNQSPPKNGQKCPWSAQQCGSEGKGITMTITAYVKDRGAGNDDQYIIGSRHGAGFLVSQGEAVAKLVVFRSKIWKVKAPFQYGKWIHYTLTWTLTDGLKFYINGEPVGTDPTGTSSTFGAVDTVHIGSTNSGNNYMFGMVDNIVIWPKHITDEIARYIYRRYFP